ncbi:ribose-phosphate diphosphokinase [Nitrososphaera sp. AFS]|uniref:ribose-phosphate diphosphokinase n=1 Tax=Nitrososphaera sp. AFS TaxID=2301191 RepID=UPI00139248CE|nr:ribose-phosphate pyrophosphokinase [Nitrososphaera sp. AFS]NAL76848.1 ribose-phosphate pyrophosphokinase [Nitrososphaera sp. AFS]
MGREISVIAGPSSVDLATKVASCLDADLLSVDFRIFKDGETKINMSKPFGKNCVLIQSTYPPTDRHLLQALMMLKKCSDSSADIVAVVPYMAYSRQDRQFLEGEVVSMAIVARLFECVGTRRLITVDIHSPASLSYFSIDARNLSATGLLAKYAITNLKTSRPVVVSPDKGGAKRAMEFARILKADMFTLSKRRDMQTTEVFVEKQKLNFDIAGRDVIIIDDMISTGESIVKASEFLIEANPNNIYAMCTHAVMIEDAPKKIEAAGVKEIISTNSIPSATAKVDLSSVISREVASIIEQAAI